MCDSAYHDEALRKARFYQRKKQMEAQRETNSGNSVSQSREPEVPLDNRSYGTPEFLPLKEGRAVNANKPPSPMPTPPPCEPISTQPSPPPEFNVVPMSGNPTFETMFPDENDDIALFDTERHY